jgi:hypothetical protein
MNRLLPLIAGVVLVAALTGAAIGWRFPFSRQARTANQLNTAQNQPSNGTRVLRSNQPTTTAQNNSTAVQGANQQTAQPLDADNADADNVNPEAAGTTDQVDANQPVPALW